MIKKCRCGSDGPFGRSGRTKDGLHTRCKKCVNKAVSKSYYANHEASKQRCLEKSRIKRQDPVYVEKERKVERDTYWSNRHEAKKKRQAKYYKNVEKSRSYHAEYNRNRRAEKADHVRLVENNYFKNNPEKRYVKNLKARLAKHHTRGTTTLEQLDQRMSYYGYTCAYCGDTYSEVDHVIPLARGGTNWPANLRPACTSCNRQKSKTVSSCWRNQVSSGTSPVFASEHSYVKKATRSKLSVDTRDRIRRAVMASGRQT